MLDKKQIAVKKLLFISGFNDHLTSNEEYNTVNKSMYVTNIERIHYFCEFIICFYSDNDPYVKYKFLRAFVDKVSTKHYLIKNARHFNRDSGYDKLEYLVNYL